MPLAPLTLDQLRADLSRTLPGALVDPLLEFYKEIKEAYLLGRFEPAELDAGKFCEVLYRILEFEVSGNFTPFGTSIKPFDAKCRAFESKVGHPESIRFHLPRLAIAIYDVRNKRGVGHVGADVNPNFSDSTLVCTAADWTLAELIRLHYACGLDQAQKWVDGLVERKLFLVHEVGGKKRILNPALPFPTKVLVILAEEFPASLDEKTLFDWTEHSNPTVFRRDVLRVLHKKKLIEHQPPACTILPPGLRVVDENYAAWSDFEPPPLAARRVRRH